MNNTYGDNNNSSLQEKYKKLDDKHKEMEKCHKEMKDKYKEMEKMYNEVNSSMESILPEVKKYLERLDSLKTSEYKDLKDKVSDVALKAIQLSKGPLKPQVLLKYLMTDVIGKQRKNVLTAAKKYSSDTRGVQNQLSELLQNVETQMVYRKNQEKLDNKFVKIIKKWETKMEESHKNEPFERRTKKRKIQYDTESASSQDSQELNIRKITEKYNDLEIISSQSSLASSSDDFDLPHFRNTTNVFQSGGSSKIVKKKKSKRSRLGTSSGEQDSGIGNDVSENEQTVPEKHFSFPSKIIFRGKKK